MGQGSTGLTTVRAGCMWAARSPFPMSPSALPVLCWCRLGTLPVPVLRILFSCGPREDRAGKEVVSGGIWLVPSWRWDSAVAHQNMGSGNVLPPPPLQHVMKSKTPSLLCKAHRLSVLGTDFNIYLLLLHP